MADELPRRTYTGKFEVDAILRRLQATETSIRDVRATIDRERVHTSEALSQLSEAAKTHVDRVVQPVISDVARCVRILEQQEMREKAKVEVEAQLIAARAREEARVDDQIKQRLFVADASGKYRAVEDEHQTSVQQRRYGWLLPAITAILGASGSALLSHFFK